MDNNPGREHCIGNFNDMGRGHEMKAAFAHMNCNKTVFKNTFRNKELNGLENYWEENSRCQKFISTFTSETFGQPVH